MAACNDAQKGGAGSWLCALCKGKGHSTGMTWGLQTQNMQRNIGLIFCWRAAVHGDNSNVKDLLGSGEELKDSMWH